jgi:hypothetical protein
MGERSDAVLRTAIGERSNAVFPMTMPGKDAAWRFHQIMEQSETSWMCFPERDSIPLPSMQH